MKKLVMVLLCIMCLSFNAYGEELKTYDNETWNGFTFKSLYPLKESPQDNGDSNYPWYDDAFFVHSHRDLYDEDDIKVSFDDAECPIQGCDRELAVEIYTVQCEDYEPLHGFVGFTNASKVEVRNINGADWKIAYYYPTRNDAMNEIVAYKMEYGRAIVVLLDSKERAAAVNDTFAPNQEYENMFALQQLESIISTLQRPEEKRYVELREMSYLSGDGTYHVRSLVPLREYGSDLKHTHIDGPNYTDKTCPIIGCKYELYVSQKVVTTPPEVRQDSVRKQGIDFIWNVAWYETTPYSYVMEAVRQRDNGEYVVRTMTVENRLGDIPFDESEKEFLKRQSEVLLEY